MRFYDATGYKTYPFDLRFGRTEVYSRSRVARLFYVRTPWFVLWL